MKNGALLRSAELAGFDVLLTVDQGIPYQQSLGGRKLSVIVIQARTNQLEDLLPFSKSILDALNEIRPGQSLNLSEKTDCMGDLL